MQELAEGYLTITPFVVQEFQMDCLGRYSLGMWILHFEIIDKGTGMEVDEVIRMKDNFEFVVNVKHSVNRQNYTRSDLGSK